MTDLAGAAIKLRAVCKSFGISGMDITDGYPAQDMIRRVGQLG